MPPCMPPLKTHFYAPSIPPLKTLSATVGKLLLYLECHASRAHCAPLGALRVFVAPSILLSPGFKTGTSLKAQLRFFAASMFFNLLKLRRGVVARKRSWRSMRSSLARVFALVATLEAEAPISDVIKNRAATELRGAFWAATPSCTSQKLDLRPRLIMTSLSPCTPSDGDADRAESVGAGLARWWLAAERRRCACLP